MLKIGITGGIGSGKTVVCKIFKLLGIPVFEADQVGKELLGTLPVKSKLKDLFGDIIFDPGGNIDRKKLAEIIFNDHQALVQANSIIHPAVREYFFEWCNRQEAPYILHEAAILFESGFYQLMDYNILIVADKELRIKRVMERDSVAAEKILQRMDKQWDDAQKAGLADVVIYNNNELLIPKVLEIDKRIKEYGKVW